MRRVLLMVFVVSLALSAGCKEDKVIAPKDVPPQPKGPPIGASKDGGGGNKNNAATAGQVKP
jgi:hypothetical protein